MTDEIKKESQETAAKNKQIAQDILDGKVNGALIGIVDKDNGRAVFAYVNPDTFDKVSNLTKVAIMTAIESIERLLSDPITSFLNSLRRK